MKTNITLIVLILAVAIVGYLAVSKNTNQADAPPAEADITSYEECVAADYTVMESYPRQCATPSGQTFTEEVDDTTTQDDESTAERSILLFYYNEENDKDESGNIKCSADGLVAVERTILVSQTPLQDAVQLLLAGDLTEDEIEAGISTEFPLSGLTLEGVTVDDDDVLVLHFDDPEFATSGGSCRANILWQQIQATATQFDTIDQVRFAPEELFQP